MKLAQAEAKNADAVASLPGLLAIAQEKIGQMQVALGNPDTSKALDAASAVSEHARILPVFKAKYPVGGIAAADTTEDAADPAVHPAFAQRLAQINRA